MIAYLPEGGKVQGLTYQPATQAAAGGLLLTHPLGSQVLVQPDGFRV
jgi:hypothetical protein